VARGLESLKALTGRFSASVSVNQRPQRFEPLKGLNLAESAEGINPSVYQ